MSDKALGATLVATSASIFTYYTLWVIVLVSVALLHHLVPSLSLCSSTSTSPDTLRRACTRRRQPFLDPALPVHDWFPDRLWAVVVPCVLLVVGALGVASFIAVTMIRSGARKQKAS
jgi:Dolichol phosphate-mannose biosynthesis regulatory protein (DPM2)